MEEKIMIKAVPISQARQHLGELINQVFRRQARIILEKGGIPVAALVSLVDLERWSGQEPELETAAQAPTPSKEVRMMTKEAISAQPPTPEELARRGALAAKILELRQESSIAPLTTAELVRKVRRERQKAYERWRQ